MDWFWTTIGLSFYILLVIPYFIYTYILPKYLSPIIYGLHLLLIVLYMLWRPKHNIEFRKWSGWEWFLNSYFKFKLKGPGAHILHPSTCDPEQQYIFAVHPHGLFACFSSYWVLSPHLTHVRCVSTSIQFYIPLIKELISMGGAIPANRGDIINTLQYGESLMITPGGMREILTHQKIYKDHVGFLKIAKAMNVKVVPIYAKGVEDLYSIWLFWPWLQSAVLHIFLYPIAIFAWGNSWLPFWPKRPKDGIKLCVGEPMVVSGSIEKAQKEFYRQIDLLKKNI